MTLLKDLDEALAGWTRQERTIPDYPHLTETWWVSGGDSVRHVSGPKELLVQAVVKSVTHTLPNVDPIPVLTALIGGPR